MTYEVKRCCDKSFEQGLYGYYNVSQDGRIDIETGDDWNSSFDDIKYCAYCGKPLELEEYEPAPRLSVEEVQAQIGERLKGLSPKDRALEELKDIMKNGGTVTITGRELLLSREKDNPQV